MLAANHDLELRNIMTIRDSVHNNGRRNGQSVDIPTRTWRILGASFFLLGLVNNVLYVIILSAALDLVSSVPKGLVLFCNIAPSLAAKIGWPYLLKGQVRYTRRIIGCCTLSFTGMLVIATFDSLAARLLGICLASFSCGLGEITFLQLITRYNSLEINGHCNLRDYYPLWQLIYQTFVFLSRSSISFGLPPLPVQYLPLPAILQGIILSILTSEAALGLFDATDGAYFVALLIAIEGICGGLAYVNVYYHIGHDHVVSPRDVVMDEEREELISDRAGNLSRSLEPSAGRREINSNIHTDSTREEWVRQAREFRMGSMGFADSFGILLASLIAMPTELYLCSLQVRRGIEYCRQI
ncbi:battenin CLN3 protein [Serendipita sp. 398]|nr:battenin CLN3 protein [Serendipita sp. 398]